MPLIIAEIEEENIKVTDKQLVKLIDFEYEEDPSGNSSLIDDERIDLYDDLNVLTKSESKKDTTTNTQTTNQETNVISKKTEKLSKSPAKNKSKKSPQSAPTKVQLSEKDLSEMNKKPLTSDLKRLIQKVNDIPQIPDYVKQSMPVIVNEPYSINTPGKLAHFFGQIHTESSWNPRSEPMGYSAKRAKEVFKSRIKDESEAQIITSKPPMAIGGLPDIVYGARKEGGRGGNKYQTTDGYDYRGHGLIQLTFKSPYYLKLNELYPNEGFLQPGGTEKINQPKWALISALLWWINHKGKVYRNEVNDTTITSVSKAVNGGTNHLDTRIKWTNYYYNLLK